MGPAQAPHRLYSMDRPACVVRLAAEEKLPADRIGEPEDIVEAYLSFMRNTYLCYRPSVGSGWRRRTVSAAVLSKT